MLYAHLRFVSPNLEAHPELHACRNFTDVHLSNKATPFGFDDFTP